MTKDVTYKAAAGELPDDPFEGATPLGAGAGPLNALASDAERQRKRRLRGEESPVPFPWRSLTDHFSGGLWNGCYILIGTTGSGKTQFAVQMAYNAACEGIPVLYVSLEGSPEELYWRFSEARIGVPWSRLMNGQLGHPDSAEDEDHTFASAKAHSESPSLAELPIDVLVQDPYGWSSAGLSQLVEAHAKRRPWNKTPRLIVLDYLQLVGSGEYGEDIRQRIQEAVGQIRAVARNQNSVVLTLSSTARDKYGMFTGEATPGSSARTEPGQGSPERFVGAGKEFGEVEYTADGVIAITGSTGEDASNPNEVRPIAIAKHRYGPKGWLNLHFSGTAFVDHSGTVG